MDSVLVSRDEARNRRLLRRIAPEGLPLQDTVYWFRDGAGGAQAVVWSQWGEVRTLSVVEWYHREAS